MCCVAIALILEIKAVGTVLGLGGGGGAKNFLRGFATQIFFYITLTYKRDTVFFISISVISKFTELSVYFILIHIHLFISHYFQTLNFFGWQNIGGGGNLPPPPPAPPVPTAIEMTLSIFL